MNAPLDLPPVEHRLRPATFEGFKQLLLQGAGISLSDSKQAMVAGRLSRRMRELDLDGFDDYLRRVHSDADERQIAIDLLTTNETHFFREPAHFALLREQIIPALPAGRTLRFWSAAASSGQEAYSIAMTLARHAAGRPWDVFGSDISTRVIDTARRAQYPMALASELPPDYLRAYCLRGIGSQVGSFAIAPEIRQRVSFDCINLNAALPDVGRFDVVFLRNILIYFRNEARQRIIERVVERLHPGGWLLVGHSESLGDLAKNLQTIAPSVYRR
ncbi:MAG TPA: protein-glutamate O-methyltransferase CheR [Arenimonas sp.]|nr:protein-glutamate O-methyltransferase CheR [Arenimonas sp.]